MPLGLSGACAFCLQSAAKCSTIYPMEILAQITTHSTEETEHFARTFAAQLHGGETLLLQGPLGAGKTHFVKGLAVGLGISDVVTSPTFALHNEYVGRLALNHFDFYRVDSAEEVEMLGLHELFCLPNAVSAIEWSDNVAELLPRNCTQVRIDVLGDLVRRITVQR